MVEPGAAAESARGLGLNLAAPGRGLHGGEYAHQVRPDADGLGLTVE